jgi:hypothetical protein
MLKNTTGGLTTQDGKGSKQGIDFEFILLFAYKVSSSPAYFFILYKQSTVPVYSMNEWNFFFYPPPPPPNKKKTKKKQLMSTLIGPDIYLSVLILHISFLEISRLPLS